MRRLEIQPRFCFNAGWIAKERSIRFFAFLARVFRGACYWLAQDHLSMRIQRFVPILCAVVLCAPAYAQPSMLPTDTFSGPMVKLFAGNRAFSAEAECRVATSASQITTFPEKIDFDSGKSRLEVNISDVKGNPLTAVIADQAKAWGIDKTVAISRPDIKTVYGVYPGLSAYDATPMQDPDEAKPASAFKIRRTKLGEESVDGHPCVKHKAVVTDEQGKSQEFTIWNATDLNKFPVKIEMIRQEGSGARSFTNDVTVVFRNVKTSKPAAALFEPPAGYKKYKSDEELMQELMKRMGNTQKGHQ